MRRFQERRKIPFAFNSEEWVKALERKKEYVLSPVIDRRVTDRRNGVNGQWYADLLKNIFKTTPF